VRKNKVLPYLKKKIWVKRWDKKETNYFFVFFFFFGVFFF